MYRPVYTKQFKKDIKLAGKQGRNIDQFKLIARSLLAGKNIDPIFKDHKLTGNYAGRRECHIESDWLLVYKIDKDMLIFERCGSHSELFKLQRDWHSVVDASETFVKVPEFVLAPRSECFWNCK